ncbi:MAG TPA: recombination factor protein RarA, partial [Dehalococcoidia bacterium]|nr:recombination factor protein RarA [Dehalococcoidia bacterium]
AYISASEDARRTSHLPIPLHLRNPATGLMREMGYGADYRYAHNEPDHYAAGERYLPEELEGKRYYQAGKLGAEATLSQNLNQQRTSGEEHFESDKG